MPTYEFLCGACEERFELFLPISSKPVQPCPKCGRGAKRLISGGAGLIFKGSGFYITDYRSSDYKAKAGADKPGGAPAAGEKKKDSGTSTGSDASGTTSKTSPGQSSSGTTPSSPKGGKSKP